MKERTFLVVLPNRRVNKYDTLVYNIHRIIVCELRDSWSHKENKNEALPVHINSRIDWIEQMHYTVVTLAINVLLYSGDDNLTDFALWFSSIV